MKKLIRDAADIRELLVFCAFFSGLSAYATYDKGTPVIVSIIVWGGFFAATCIVMILFERRDSRITGRSYHGGKRDIT